MKKKYDLIFGIGQACSCSQILRQSELQQFSYPLDWLAGGDFAGRVELLYTGFERFIDKNDLESTNQNNHDSDNLCDIYKNINNNIVFNHDFPCGVPLEDSYKEVKDKYDRRIARLEQQIEEANNILVVYVEIPMEQNKMRDNEVLISNFNKIIEKYPNKTIDLLYFVNDMSFKPGRHKKEQVTDRITKVTGHYKSTRKQDIDIIVAKEFFKKFFNSYELNISLKYKIQRKLIKTIIPFIPVKKVRKSMRKKYHVMH